MRICTILVVCSLFVFSASAQTLSFKKSGKHVKEPYENENVTTQKVTLDLQVADLKKGMKLKADPIQISKNSTFPTDKVKMITTSIDSLKEENKLEVEVSTDLSDKDKYIVVNVNYENVSDSVPEKKQFSDTIFIDNVYPFSVAQPKEYTNWNDGKRAEIFLGTNFDFFGSTTLSDWYGGVSVFLPGITDFKFHSGGSGDRPRFGINAGLYHSKSFTNFGNMVSNDNKTILRQVVRRYTDTVNNVPIPAVDYRQDTVLMKSKMEINNWGAYAGIMYQFSRFENTTDNFVTNIFVGFHAELIRRNVYTSYELDTLGSELKTSHGAGAAIRSGYVPKDARNVYFDAYYGVNMPIQFLWKDIIDFKLIPSLGFASASYRSYQSRTVPGYYLVNFDLLARLGGLRLNLGGEIRGFFPNNDPIFSAYLGTSFSVSKLVDFISK